MRRSSLLAIAATLAVTSTSAYALARQTHWMGGVTGKEGTKITGSAMMMAGKDAGTTEVTLELKDDAAAATRPWHVHVGTCATRGPVFGGGRSYTPITANDKGAGKSVATLAVALPDTGRYHVNVHESPSAMGNIVACGDLSKM